MMYYGHPGFYAPSAPQGVQQRLHTHPNVKIQQPPGVPQHLIHAVNWEQHSLPPMGVQHALLTPNQPQYVAVVPQSGQQQINVRPHGVYHHYVQPSGPQVSGQKEASSKSEEVGASGVKHTPLHLESVTTSIKDVEKKMVDPSSAINGSSSNPSENDTISKKDGVQQRGGIAEKVKVSCVKHTPPHHLESVSKSRKVAEKKKVNPSSAIVGSSSTPSENDSILNRDEVQQSGRVAEDVEVKHTPQHSASVSNSVKEKKKAAPPSAGSFTPSENDSNYNKDGVQQRGVDYNSSSLRITQSPYQHPKNASSLFREKEQRNWKQSWENSRVSHSSKIKSQNLKNDSKRVANKPNPPQQNEILSR